MRKLSNNAIREYRGCPQLYEYEYVHLRAPLKKSEALSFGSAWDLMLQSWWSGQGAEDRMAKGAGILRREIRDEWLQAKALAMLVGYSATWGDEPLKCVATQVEFTCPFTPAHPVFQSHGILDAIVETPSGERVGLESKTSGEDITPGSAYWQRVVTLDTQVSTYLAGAASAGYRINRVVYDVVKKPELRPKSGETPQGFTDRCIEDMRVRPSWYFQRQEIVRLARDEQKHAQDVYGWASQIAMAEMSHSFPRNPDHCRKYGRPCDFLPVCLGEAELDDPGMFKRRERR